jgi:hypothetical protein
LPIIFLVDASIYFNSAIFSAGISGGPQMLIQRHGRIDLSDFVYGIGFLMFAVTIFLFFKPIKWDVGSKTI